MAGRKGVYGIQERGNRLTPTNYRGISVTRSITDLYDMVVSARDIGAGCVGRRLGLQQTEDVWRILSPCNSFVTLLERRKVKCL